MTIQEFHARLQNEDDPAFRGLESLTRLQTKDRPASSSEDSDPTTAMTWSPWG